VVGAKLLVYAGFGALAGVASSLVGAVVAAAWWSHKGVSYAWSNAHMGTTIGGGIAWNSSLTAIGVGLGALIRSLVGAIAVALAWIALVEGIVGQLFGNLARWLPFNAGQALGAGAEAMTAGHLLPRWGGGVVLTAYTLVFAVLAVVTTRRRDVP
jgi:ABC-2 type transport system permease protein